MSESNRALDYYYDPLRPIDRRKRSGAISKTWKVTELQEIHHRIIQELHLGKSNRFIANKFGISEVMVSNVKNSPAAQDKLAILRAVTDAETIDVRKEIIKRAPEALETLSEIMRAKGTQAALKARIAMDQLDRAGYAPVRQIETKNLHAHRFIDENDLREIKERAMEIAAQSSVVV